MKDCKYKKKLSVKTILKKDNNNLGPAYSVKLVFSCVVKRIKIITKITKKFCASRCLHFEDTERIMSP